jgi:uncharacterized protein YcsI (UPF0317 family)
MDQTIATAPGLPSPDRPSSPGPTAAPPPEDAGAVRARIRAGAFDGHTAGLAPGHVQANIAILPAAEAMDFAAYCRANAQACPLLAISQPGDPRLPTLGAAIDIRHDLPRYRIYRNGVPAEATDIASLWRDDLVTMAIGCSFTFDDALIAQGIVPRHVAAGRFVSMYRTARPTIAVGRFHGPLVVSMRPFPAAIADRAAAISACYPLMHGAPVHRGDPAALGIADLARPDYGEAVTIEADEEPLFWACGVTSQVALQTAGLPFFIAHAPGCMLITDVRREGS